MEELIRRIKELYNLGFEPEYIGNVLDVDIEFVERIVEHEDKD